MGKKNPSTCDHGAVCNVALLKGEFSDPDVKVYICTQCGFPHFVAPINKFKNNPEALKLFEKMAEEIEIDLKAAQSF